MKLSDCLTPSSILLELGATSKSDVFSAMVDNLIRGGLDYAREDVLSALEDREALMSTGISHWLGMPHGRLKGLGREVISIGISRRGIDYDSLDHEPVHVVVMILSPEEQPMLHIEALSATARIFSSERFLRMLCDAESADAVLDMIRNEEQ